MSRMSVYRCLSLLGVVGGLGGCAANELESAEETAQLRSAAIVSSITEGDYVIRSAMTNKCVDISSSSTADGAKVQQWDCNGTNAQKFHISPTSDGYWKIINVNSNKAIDVKDVSTAQNALFHQWTYVGGNNQQFKFVARGNNQFSIHVRHTDMVMDLYWGSANNGTEYVQYPYTGTANQLYTFDKVDGTTPGNGLGAILSESTFNSMFPGRNPFYSYSSLVAAAATFPSFATTGDTDTRKREVAAFLANVAHETGNLVYIEEINKSVMCDTSWGPPGCGCAPGKMYYGRGPIQLSWNGNYCAAGNALGLNLMNDPDILSRDATASWRSGLWFWNTQTGAGSMTAHNAMVNNAGFGETIRTINGALECNGRNPAQVQSRIDNYLRFTNMLGVSAGSNLGC
ncbi:RICIN domain-containing protein [Archangium violaceum]|uniref:RICIN domain-containing protein n=1 Tax=Archangium violaceum TaxID=83451 RepID=UPI00194E2B00|nr:RICIN domain-containing protein [Archangium violaceum]QRN95553.1 RICIN domain-containing protein [Archangium violaceum]